MATLVTGRGVGGYHMYISFDWGTNAILLSNQTDNSE